MYKLWICHKSFDYIIIFFICSGDIFDLDGEGGSVLDLDTGSYNKVFGNLFDYGEKKQDEIIVLNANKQTRWQQGSAEENILKKKSQRRFHWTNGDVNYVFMFNDVFMIKKNWGIFFIGLSLCISDRLFGNFF